MRHSLKGIIVAALFSAFVAGCSTVQVSQPGVPQKAPDDSVARNAHWQFDNASRPPADSDGYRPPRLLAVLLPLSGGNMTSAAASVRDGLLAGYYGEPRRRPEIRFYDTAGTVGGATAAYAKAVADGADQILGPLGRDEVDAVFRGVQPGAPVLALNRGVVPPPFNSASYSLAPEDDGSSAADYLASQHAQRVLVLSSGDDYAVRSVKAFGEQFATHGGTVQVLAVVGDKPVLDLSSHGNVDAVFIALRGAQARAIAPQLAIAGFAGKPRVATSQLTSGTGKAEEDRALDGIAFPTERWGVMAVSGLPNAAATATTLPTARGPAAKLFAFGHDAWLLTAYLEHLALTPDSTVSGATGVLQIGPAGNVLRAPAWSTFSNGTIVPLATRAGG
jgi:outer membrane PBP1 activator LpoA protein